MTDCDAVGVRLTLVGALAVDAAEAVISIAGVIRFARREAAERLTIAARAAARSGGAGGVIRAGLAARYRQRAERSQHGHRQGAAEKRGSSAHLDVLGHAGTFIPRF